MLILQGKRRSLVGYHASLRPLRRLSNALPLHIGSEKQALVYGRWAQQRKMEESTRRVPLYLYKVTVPVGKKRVLLSRMATAIRNARGRDGKIRVYDKSSLADQMRLPGGKRFLDEAADYNRLDPYLNFEGDPRIRDISPYKQPVYRRLQKRYDILPYKNRAEGHGLSVALLHPRKARLKLVKHWVG